MKSILFSLSLFLVFAVEAQDLINQEFTTLKPTYSMSFQSIINNTKILAMGLNEGVFTIYDKMWDELERHSAGQEEISYQYISASRSYGYDYTEETHTTKEWITSKTDVSRNKYDYSLGLSNNYLNFTQGETNELELIRSVNEIFLERHSVSLFGDNFQGISELPRSLSNNYIPLTTHFEIVDWNGQIKTTISLPYYVRSGSCYEIKVEDRTYIIVFAFGIYPKTIIKDCSLYSTEEYEISSYQVEPDCYHYFIYQYDKPSGSANLIKTEAKKADHSVIGIYDLNGNRHESEQTGVNILLYSDGTSRKIVRP